MGTDDSVSYHDADEPTRSNASTRSGGDRPRGNAQSERTSEVFLTADDFMTSDDASSEEDGSSGIWEEEFVSPSASARRAGAGASAEAFRQQMLAEEDACALQADGSSQGEEADVMYSAPNTPTAAQTPQQTGRGAGEGARQERPRLDSQSPRGAPGDGVRGIAYLAKRTVLSKMFVRTRAASGRGARVGSSFVTMQQLEHARGPAAGAPEHCRHGLLGASPLVAGAVECAAQEPEPIVYAWHLKPDKRDLLKSFRELKSFRNNHAASTRLEIPSRSGLGFRV